MDYQNSVREFNNARILSLLRRHSPLSRADISRHTDLNRSTVSSIIEDLLGAGFVREIGLRQVSTGRPSIMLEIDTDHYGVLALTYCRTPSTLPYPICLARSSGNMLCLVLN